MRAPRAPLVALAIGLLGVPLLAWSPAVPAAAQLGAVSADKDGWWDRASDQARPLTSPGLPFAVPANALAISASNGEPDKVAAVGIALGVDPIRFQRLLLNITESATAGSTVGGQAAAIDACAITATWSAAKGGAWATLPPAETTNCAAGQRSTTGVWSFDVTAIAKRWLSGSLAPNGVLLREKVDSPVTFQVALDDHTTPTMSFSLDLTPVDDTTTTTTTVSSPSSDSGTTSSDTPPAVVDTPPSTSYAYSSADSFTVPAATPTTAPAAPRSGIAAPASRTSRPIGLGVNHSIPLAALILVPLALLGALGVMLSLGPLGSPTAGNRKREGGVSRALARRSSEES
jgi:hypothetical protein